ncbi:MAG: 5-(carboxyamino)imidazole ribonucleotide mutase [Peptococcaceae bacterium]|nr:5-(carboxyamino)imidazole ribonucleotide mutase [Peptococcaceae bacterium]
MRDPVVGIVVGSESDLPVVRDAGAMLERLGIGWELVLASAHRTPDLAAGYAANAAGRGIRVLIAAAGGAAHLAGACAARTVLPVIGLPVGGGALAGLDALYATVQMPPGVPVATVAINGAVNAALLAAQIIALGDDTCAARLGEYRRELTAAVEEKSRALTHEGLEAYMARRFGKDRT